MGVTDHNRDQILALTLADTADAITMDRVGAADLQVDRKPDRTPVTDADLAVEEAIRAVLGQQRPQDAVLGEEGGVRLTSEPAECGCWIRSTGRRTSCAACRSGPPSSRSSRTAGRWSG